MPNIKEAVISMLKDMPENSTLEDIMESLYLKQKNELPRRKQRGIKIFHKRSKRPKGRGIHP